jgi:Phage capsid family
VVNVAKILGTETAEGAVKPVSELALAADYLDPIKVVSILVVTEELLRLGMSAEAFLTRELQAAVAHAADEEFISALSGAVSPAEASSDDLLTDLETMLAEIEAGADAKFFLLITAANAKKLATSKSVNGGQAYPGFTPNGGTVAGIEVLVSDAISDGVALLVDASQIAAASSLPILNSAREAAVALDGETLTSLWQKNLVGLRVERFVGFRPLFHRNRQCERCELRNCLAMTPEQ